MPNRMSEALRHFENNDNKTDLALLDYARAERNGVEFLEENRSFEIQLFKHRLITKKRCIMLRNIPIKTSIKIGLGGNGRSHGNDRGVDSGSFTPKAFKKEVAKKRKMILPYRPPTGAKEVPLDLFKENRDEFNVIGEFPGLNKVDDLVIQLDKNGIFVVTKPIETQRTYFGSCKLPKAWMTTIDQKVLNNGVMTVVLRKKGRRQRDASDS